MATQLTAEGAQQSLTAHVEAKGIEIFVKYGSPLGWAELQALLNDRAYVRYPCEIVFDHAQLNPGEFAYPMPKGDAPEQGFTMFVHPVFMLELARVPALVLYHLVAVNYGEFASSDDAETFGAAALGLTRDEYYAMMCECADQVGASENAHPDAGACASGDGCSCGG
jgi:hypothetical protein